MKTLSLWQPWAQLILDRRKLIETRSWPTYHRGPMAIHASRSVHRKDAIAFGYNPDVLPVGAVICIVELVDVKQMTEQLIRGVSVTEKRYGHYEDERYAWYLKLTQVLPEPVPVKGSLGLWEWVPLKGTI